jgi:hypothetical protein
MDILKRGPGRPKKQPEITDEPYVPRETPSDIKRLRLILRDNDSLAATVVEKLLDGSVDGVVKLTDKELAAFRNSIVVLGYE